MYLLLSLFALYNHKMLILIFSPLIILIAFYSKDLLDFLYNLWEGFLDIKRVTVDGRLFQYKVSIETGLSNLFLGAGHEYTFNGQLEHVVHNSFLYQFYSIGIFGFLVYCSIYYNTIKSFIKTTLITKFHSPNFGFIISLFSSFIGVCIELSFFRVISGKIQWLIIYLILINSSLMMSKNETSNQISKALHKSSIRFK
jgi:hypothetical protein